MCQLDVLKNCNNLKDLGLNTRATSSLSLHLQYIVQLIFQLNDGFIQLMSPSRVMSWSKQSELHTQCECVPYWCRESWILAQTSHQMSNRCHDSDSAKWWTRLCGWAKSSVIPTLPSSQSLRSTCLQDVSGWYHLSEVLGCTAGTCVICWIVRTDLCQNLSVSHWLAHLGDECGPNTIVELSQGVQNKFQMLLSLILR